MVGFKKSSSFFWFNKNKIRIAIFGAGSAGKELFETLRFNSDYRVKFFIDDDQNLHNTSFKKIKIFSRERARYELKIQGIDKILIAISEIYPDGRSSAIKFATECSIPAKVIPSLIELERGTSEISSLRDVQIEEVLQRKPIAAMPHLVDGAVLQKSVLVTGAGGSIGSELCRQIISAGPSKLILLDNSEFGLYKINEEIADFKASRKADFDVVPVLGSVNEPQDLENLFSNHKIDSVFHAAAYKHVPLVESNIVSGLRNNVFGTKNLVDACGLNCVQRFTLISTDKAVRPTNVMGASKKLSEIIVHSYRSRYPNTQFRSVRFGNVLGSSGSVIPKFQGQILNGGPVTVTHPEVTRYFMTIPEACQLVLQASALQHHADIFVLDMGSPVKIVDLAETIIRKYGYLSYISGEPRPSEKSIEITFTGLRRGEKLYEELLYSGTEIETEHPFIKSETSKSWNTSYLEEILNKLQCLIEINDEPKIIDLLKSSGLDYIPTSTN